MGSEQITTNGQQGSSNALKKFQSLHPDQHELFSSILETAKQNKSSVFPLPSESEEINGEWCNMVKNRELIKYREADKLFEAKRMRKCQGKFVTWRKNLVDIKPITPQEFCSTWPRTFDIQSSYKRFSVAKLTKKEESGVTEENKSIFESRRISYAEVVTGTTKLANNMTSYQSVSRKR